MANNLSESLDFYGLPLCESEIEVKFIHDGRPAVAVFEVEGGHRDKSKSREFPPEHVDPTIELVGLHFVDGAEIYAKDVLDLGELETAAIEKYWDQED